MHPITQMFKNYNIEKCIFIHRNNKFSILFNLCRYIHFDIDYLAYPKENVVSLGQEITKEMQMYLIERNLKIEELRTLVKELVAYTKKDLPSNDSKCSWNLVNTKLGTIKFSGYNVISIPEIEEHFNESTIS